MKLTPEYKEEVSKKVVESMLQALEKDLVKDYEMSGISRTFLEKIELVKTQEDLIELLDGLATDWDFFRPLVIIEKGKIHEQHDHEDVSKILDLAKEGRIEDAISVAKATYNT